MCKAQEWTSPPAMPSSARFLYVWHKKPPCISHKKSESAYLACYVGEICRQAGSKSCHGGDRSDSNQGKDQGVFGQPLTGFLV